MDKNKKRKLEQLALKYMSKGIYNKAIKEYKTLLESFPEEITYLKQIAKSYQNTNQTNDALMNYGKLTDVYKKKGLYKQAIAIYSVMMGLGETREEIYDNLAFCYTELNREGDATQVYRKLLENYMKKALFRSAVSVASKILAINPEDTIALINAAEAQLSLNDKVKSIDLFRIVAGIYKKQNNLAMYMKILGRINHVSDNNDAKTLNELASIYLTQRNYGKEPLELLLKAYRIAKESTDDKTLIETTKLLVTFFKETNQRKQMLSIRFELAKIYERINEKDKALETYNKILQIAPGSQEVRLRAKELQKELQKVKEKNSIPIPSPVSKQQEHETITPKDTPKKMKKFDESEIKNILREVDTYIKFKLYAKAEPILKSLYEKHPKVTSITNRLKEVYIKTHKAKQVILLLFNLFEGFYKEDSVKAREYLEEILYFEPQNSKANMYLDKYYNNNSGDHSASNHQEEEEEKTIIGKKNLTEYDKAIDIADIADSIDINFDDIDIDDGETDSELEKIRFYINQGMFDSAKNSLDKKLKENPNDTELLKLLSDLEKAVKPIIIGDTNSEGNEEIEEDVEDILRQFKKGVDESISKDDVSTRYDLGIAYKAMGLLDDAIGEFKLIYKSSGKKIDCLMMIGLCYNDKAEFDTSIKYFKKAIELSTNSTQRLALYYEVANAYDLLGNLKHAFNIFKKISQKDKTFRDSYKRLKEIHAKIKASKNNISYL